MTIRATHTISRMRTISLLLCCLAFGLAYWQAPLYYSNQNQYFLHGLAQAGVGLLEEDWLSNTADPTPLFSSLVAFTIRFLHPLAFHFYYLILHGVYLVSLLGIFIHLAGKRDTPRLRLMFIFAIILIHSGLMRWLSNLLVGLDFPWYLQAGVAGQYTLGGMFQPSTFGVLLLLSVNLFLRGHPCGAAALASLTATIHFTYLLPAAMFTLGFLYLTWREAGFKRAFFVGAWGLLCILPVMIYVLLQFRPTSAETFRESQHILVHFRIPHHCLPYLWLDSIAALQIGWICLGAALTYGSRIFPLMLIAIVVSAALSITQVVTESDTLALLFPWRVSALLMPMATTAIVSRLILLMRPLLDQAWARWVAILGVAALAVAGPTLFYLEQAYRTLDEDRPVMAHVRNNLKPGDRYLIPVRLPELKKTTRGSLSPDFRPLAQRRPDQRLIPMDLQRFRLHAEAPIHVDFKAIPYRDTDVIEWRRRLDQAVKWQEAITTGKLNTVRAELKDAGITHIVVTANHRLSNDDWEQTFADEAYRVYRLRK